jgi:hypothetical protein
MDAFVETEIFMTNIIGFLIYENAYRLEVSISGSGKGFSTTGTTIVKTSE